MARRVFSFPVRSEGGPVIGGTSAELRIYDDAALTTLSTIYAAETGATTIPNPRTPNAGRQSALLADRAAVDTFVTVVDITGFAVGDLIPIYNGTATVYRVITVITGGTRRFDLDAALGVIFLASNTVVGNLDMKGHIYGWLDDVRDYYMQSKNVASTRVLPPVGLPVRVPASVVEFQEEGAVASTRAKLNFVSPFINVTDDIPNTRGIVTGPLSAVPAIVLGTAAAQGVATTLLRTDATIVAFDTTLPADVGSVAAVGTAAVSARRDHVHVTPTTTDDIIKWALIAS